MRKKKNSRKRKWKSGVKAGCLALGMATAWGGEASGDLIAYASITPEQTLTDAYVFFENNVTGGAILSLGTLPSGKTTYLEFEEVPYEGYTIAYQPVGGRRQPYVVIGLYDEGGAPGVAISFPDQTPINEGTSWDEIFNSYPSEYDYANYTEAEVIDILQTAAGTSSWIDLWWFFTRYGSDYSSPCATEFGHEATLVCFSDATYGGVVTFDVVTVPEPAAWVLFVGLSVTVLLWRRDLFRG
jgi:hypothetical protein